MMVFPRMLCLCSRGVVVPCNIALSLTLQEGGISVNLSNYNVGFFNQLHNTMMMQISFWL